VDAKAAKDRRSPTRSRSRDGAEKAAKDSGKPRIEIEDGKPKNNGDKTFQCCIFLKKSNGYGVGREITVRAPLREDRDEADKDGDDLLDAYEEGGYEAVRKLQRELKTKGR
jgi:hypothetical protein